MPPVVAPKLKRRKAGVEPGFHQSNVTGQIVKNKGKRLLAGGLGDTTTGISEGSHPTLTGTPPTFVEGPRPPAVGPELTRQQESRFARLKNRKELGRDYNEDRFAKLLAIKKGAGKAIPTTGPAGATGPTGPTQVTPPLENPLAGNPLGSSVSSDPFYTPMEPYINTWGQTPQEFLESHGAEGYNTITPVGPYQSKMNDRRIERLERLLSRKEAGKNYNENRLEKLEGFSRQDKQFQKFMDKLAEYDKWGQMYGGPGQAESGAATYSWYKNLTPEQQAQVAGLMFANKGLGIGNVAGGVGPGTDIFPTGSPVSMGGLLSSSFPGLAEAYIGGLGKVLIPGVGAYDPDSPGFKSRVWTALQNGRIDQAKYDSIMKLAESLKDGLSGDRGGHDSTQAPQTEQAVLNNPAVQQASAALQEFEKTKGFLPMTPEFEAQRRQLEDQLASALMSIGVARDQIPYYVNMMSQRMNTDEMYATQALNESMTDRGILGSSIVPWTQTRDIGVPFGRQRQDLALGAAQQYGDLATAQGEAYNTYYNQLMEALLGRAAQVSSQMPLSVPQYKPRKPGKTKPGKNKPGTKPRGRR